MAKRRCNLTFYDVKKLFQEKGVQLLSDETDYNNKRIYMKDKFLMKAKICLHEKIITLNNFQQDKGLNYCQSCFIQQQKSDYNIISKLFEKKGCKLLVTEQEYNENNMNGSTALKFIGNCGHKYTTTYFNLLKYDNINKKNCRKCAGKNQNLKSQKNLEKNLQQTKKICAEKNLQYIKSLQEYRKCTQHILKCQNNHDLKRTIGELKSGKFYNHCNSNVKQSIYQQQSVSTGDYHEQYVFNLISNYCKTIEIVGNTGNLYDIIYTLYDNIKRGIQVKTLSQFKYKDNVFGCSVTRGNGTCYPKDTLMVLINNKHQKFVTDMSQNFTTNRIAIFFNSNKCKYQNTKFTDQNLFVQNLISLLPQASEIDVSKMYPSDTLKEINCFERLKKKCTELGLSFQRNTTNGRPIDCYINHKAIQVKYREGDYKQNVVLFGLYKNGGTKNGKHIHIPYSEDDEIEFFVFEYGGQNGNFLSNFCILSKQFLIQKKYLSTPDIKGKTNINIWKQNDKSDRDKIGTSKFWNKFDQLQ